MNTRNSRSIRLAFSRGRNEQVRWFYSDLLGLKLAALEPSGSRQRYLQDEQEIELVEVEFLATRNQPLVVHTSDFAAARLRLRTAGFALDESRSLPERPCLEVQDPAGTLVTVCAYEIGRAA